MKKMLCLVVALILVFGIQILSCSSAEETVTLNDVKSNKKTATEYLDYLSETIPEVKKAKEKGMLNGIIYNPSEEKMKILLAELLKDQANSEEIVNDALAMLEYQSDDSRFRILPSSVCLAGKGIPVFIVAYSNAFEHFESDSEIEGVLLHEIKHINDVYHGVTIAGRLLNWESFEKNEISILFWQNLLELRAHHQELYRTLDDMINENKSYNNFYVIHTGANYIKHYFGLQESITTDTERLVAERQFKLFDNLQPVRKNDNEVDIKFILDNGEDGGIIIYYDKDD